MGKWSHLEKEGIPEKPREQNERTKRLFQEVDKLKLKSLDEVAHALLEGQARKKRAAEEEKEANFEIEVAEITLRKLLKAQGLDSVVMRGHRFTPEPAPWPQVKDKHALLEWAKENMPDEIQMHASVLLRTVKQALDGEGELPPGVDVYFSSGISVTKSSKGS